MTDEINNAVTKAHILDEKTQNAIAAVKHKGFNAIRWAVVSWLILFFLAVSVLVQNYIIGIRNTHHIDCIIKDLATPPPKGASPNAKKYIENLSTDCNIKFTQ